MPPAPCHSGRGAVGGERCLALIFLFWISLCAVFSVLGRRSPWGRQTASLGSGLSPYRPFPPRIPSHKHKVSEEPCPWAGGFLFLTSASMSQSADSLADGLPRAQGNPALHILDRWPFSLSASVSTCREHITPQDSHAHFGQLELSAGFSFILRKGKSI